MEQIGPVISRNGLADLGLEAAAPVRWNLAVPALVQLAVGRGEAVLPPRDRSSPHTGAHTGRAPTIASSSRAAREKLVDWGNVNKPHAR